MIKHKQLMAWFMLPLIIGVCVTGLITWQLQRMNHETIEDAVRIEATKLATEISRRLHLYEFGLRGARGAVVTAGEANMSRELFRRYSLTRDINKEFPGARGFGFIRRVSQEQENDFLAKARLDGKPDFSIRQLTLHLGDRYIIQYIEPAEKNSVAIGLDTASEDHRREAAEAAMRSGKVTITAPITLVQATGNPSQSFLVFLPIYSGAKTPTTQAERETQLMGWSYAPLLMPEVLANLSMDAHTTELTLRDITNDGAAELFFTSPKTSTDLVKTHVIAQELMGRRWQIEFSVNAAFVEKLHLLNEQTLFLIGLLLSILIASLLRTLNLNQYRKHFVLEEQARIAAIVESSIDGIIGKSLDGVVTSWNKGAEAIFGYSAAEAIGETLASLVVPSELQHEEANILACLRKGETVHHFITQRHRKDGTRVPVSVAVAPIRNPSGEIVGASKTVRDITEQKAAEDKILDLNLNLEVQVVQRTAQLELARRSLQTVLDAVPSMIGYWDKHLINRVANRAYHEWFGLDHLKIPGMHARELLGEKLFEFNRAQMEAALRGEPQNFNRTLNTPAGERYSLAQYLPDIENGEVQGFYVIVHDISEITHANNQLQNALRENQAILSTIDKKMLYSVTDLRGNIIDVNANFCATSGYSREELIGQNHRLLSSGNHSAEFWHSMWADIIHGKSWHGEVCNRSKNGDLCWFDTVVTHFTDVNGKTERYISLCTNITERKLAESERSKLSSFITSVLNAATELAIIATDVNGLITVFNRGAELMLGYSADEVVGKTSPAPFHLMDEIIIRGQELSHEYNELIEGFRVFVHKPEIDGAETRNWTYVRKSGSQIQISLIATPVRDEGGVITGYLGVATDITKDLDNKKQIESTIAQLNIAAKIAELGIWSWDINDNSLLWSDRMFDMYDQPKHLNNNGLNYQHWYECVHPDDVTAAAELLTAAVEGRGVYDTIFRVVTKSGAIRFIQAGAQIERDITGVATKVTGVNRDVTAQKELEATLVKAKEAADVASASKSVFLANMSHEIRTPMNAVLGMLQLLHHTELTERQKDYLTKSHSAAKSLLGLLNDILDFSKIDSGKLQLDIHAFELEPLLRDLAVILSANQGEKNVEILFDIDPALPKMLIADRLRLQQILINLAGNALKFTHKGQVVVTLKMLEQNSRHVRLQVAVSDTGIGISPEQMNRIFEGFVQAEASITRRYGGTGLGLVISKRLIDLMGGELKLESEIGVGSRFWFEIALEAYTLEHPSPQIIQASLAELRVLVVDDNELSREVLTRALEFQGIQTDKASGGLEAVEKVRLADALNKPYDLVLMDWRMPDMDGLIAAESIQKTVVNAKPPIMIAVTAYGREEVFTKQWSNAQPFVDVLTKPVTPEQLTESILRAISGAESNTYDAKALEVRQQPLAGIRLLVVEDNELNRQVAFELLTGEGASVELAEGGLEGVAKVLAGYQAFDLVIMDVQMPDIDGLEATRRIRENIHCKTLPILAMTANASLEDRAACLNVGMTDHVGKPIDMEQIIPRILTLVGNKQVPIIQKKNAISVNDTTREVEDFAVILKRFSGKVDLYSRMFVSFETDITRLLEKAKLQSELKETAALTAALHSIKGVASTMGAKALALKAATLESKFKSADTSLEDKVLTPDDLNELTSLLEKSCVQLKHYVEGYQQTAPVEVAAADQMSATELNAELEKILTLLKSDNLSAIDSVVQLHSKSSTDQQSQLSLLLTQVNELQFALAITTITQLLQRA